MKKTRRAVILLVLLLQLTIIIPTMCFGSAPLPESPSLSRMSEVSDLILTGTAFNITETGNYTYIHFNDIKYLKNPQNNTTFTLQYYSGSTNYRIPLEVNFEQGVDYLVFLVHDEGFHVAYGDFGKIELSQVTPETLDILRFVNDPLREVQFQGLTISPNDISKWENITATFTIINLLTVENTIGFIIEHHPPAYQIIDEANTSLKYFQYTKSVSLGAGKERVYDFTFSSKYTGVNTVVVNYLGHQVLAETFTVLEPAVAYIEEPSISWNLVFVITVFSIIGVLVLIALILLLKRIRSQRIPKTPSNSPPL